MYYYNSSEQKEYFVNLYSDKGDYKTKYYLLLETFSNQLFERKLFELNNVDVLLEGDQISLDTLPFLKGKPEKLKIEGLDRLVIEKKVEHSILNKIKTIIFSIEKKISKIFYCQF